MRATTYQKKLIHVNSPNRDIKEEFVQWATGDVEKISCNDLSFVQANEILKQLGKRPVALSRQDSPNYWGGFDSSNKQHKTILKCLHNLKWTVDNFKYGKVADIERFGNWLQSDKAPVKKPLKQMSNTPKPSEKISEISKTIFALEAMGTKKYK